MVPTFNIPQQPKAKSKGKYLIQGDRIVPNQLTKQQYSRYQSLKTDNLGAYHKLLYSSMNVGNIQRTKSSEKVLQYNNNLNLQSECQLNQINQQEQQQSPLINLQIQSIENIRKLPSYPIFSLDAPGIVNDVCNTPLDWSTLDYIALAANNQLYAYHNDRRQLVHFSIGINSTESQFTSVRWSRQMQQLLASGNNSGQLELWDVVNQQKIISIRVARNIRRVNCITIADNMVACGCSNAMLNIYDSRVENRVATLQGHSDSILNARFQNDSFSRGPYLVTTSADGLVLVWDLRNRENILFKLQGHQGAVKALDWSPKKTHMFATGGGDEMDQSLRVWNASTGENIQEIQCKSEITSLVFNDPSLSNSELFSGHGQNDNAIRLWKVDNQVQLEDEILNHKQIVLSLAINQANQTLCSLGADECMKFWNIEEPKQKQKKTQSFQVGTFR